jgi:tetratricopeptide (TPR) repeat protein
MAGRGDCSQGKDDGLTIKSCTLIVEGGSTGNNVVAYYNLGNAYSRRGDFVRAIFDYNQAIGLNPKFAEAFNNRGFAYSKKGDLDRAIADYCEAIRLNPKFPEALYSQDGRKGKNLSCHGARF